MVDFTGIHSSHLSFGEVSGEDNTDGVFETMMLVLVVVYHNVL